MNLHRVTNNVRNMVLLLLGWSVALHAEQRSDSVFINPQLSYSLRIPVKTGESGWKPYATVGFSCEIPSVFSHIICIGGIDGGKVENSQKEISVQTLNFFFGISHTGIELHPRMSVQSGIGLTNMMVGGSRDGLLDFPGRKVFGSVENEYGLFVSIEPIVRVREFFFKTHFRMERIFTSPDPTDYFIISGYAGYHIVL